MTNPKNVIQYNYKAERKPHKLPLGAKLGIVNGQPSIEIWITIQMLLVILQFLDTCNKKQKSNYFKNMVYFLEIILYNISVRGYTAILNGFKC